jgi:hypothetical protein
MTTDENRQHNLRLPISRIPNEILSKIFCNLRNGSIGVAEQKPWRFRGNKFLKGLVGITHVSHVWRKVALDTSLLWCHIEVFPLFRNWIPELLWRSKQSPLSVIIGRAAQEHNLLEEVTKHFGRVRELVLHHPRLDTAHEILSSQRNFPKLESLEISLSDPPFVLNDSHVRAERLRRLALRSCSVDWNSKLLHGLTHLRLVNIPDACKLGYHDFTHILSKIPALEVLHLSQFLLKEEQVPAHPTLHVHLQHLQLFSAYCEVPELAQFLPCIVVPRSCKLRFSTGNDPIDDEFRVVLSWVSNQFREPTTSLPSSDTHGQYIRSFHLMFDPDQALTLKGFCNVLSHEELDTTDPILEFLVRETDYESSFDMDTFLSLLPLGRVTFLDVLIASGLRLYPKFWTNAFGSMQNITTVYLNAETSGFWKALIPASSVNDTSKSLPFPALSSVTVEDPYLNSQLILEKLRVRSKLGDTQLQHLGFSSRGLVPTAPLMIHLGRLVSSTQVVETRSTNECTDESSASESDED